MAGTEQQMITWRVLPEFPDYKISSTGEVRERKSNLPLASWKIEGEVYYVLRLPNSSRENTRRMSSLMVSALKTGDSDGK